MLSGDQHICSVVVASKIGQQKSVICPVKIDRFFVCW